MDGPDGFADYVAGQRNMLVRFGFLLTGDHQLAEDLVQTALARVWPRWSRVGADANIDAYVRKSILSVFLSWRRRRWTGEVPVAVFPERGLPEDAYSRLDQANAMLGFLRQLPPRQRAVIVLRYYLDLSEVESAELLNCSAGTVKSQNHKALRGLRSLIESGGLRESVS